jgi:hypothetical protein
VKNDQKCKPPLSNTGVNIMFPLCSDEYSTRDSHAHSYLIEKRSTEPSISECECCNDHSTSDLLDYRHE